MNQLSGWRLGLACLVITVISAAISLWALYAVAKMMGY